MARRRPARLPAWAGGEELLGIAANGQGGSDLGASEGAEGWWSVAEVSTTAVLGSLVSRS